MLRFPDGMRERLKQHAADHGRSLNAEIIRRLQTTLEMDGYIPEINAHIASVDKEDPFERAQRLLEEANLMLEESNKLLKRVKK